MKTVNNYQLIDFEESISVDHLVTVHYFEYSKNYIFEGEKHNFWEFLYVDKGEVHVMADERKYILEQGEMIFHKPNEWHNVIANGEVAPNLVVIAFDCHSVAMKHLENKVISLPNYMKGFLGNIVAEAKQAYSTDISAPNVRAYTKRKKILFGSEQLIKLNLEMLLIQVIRHDSDLIPVTRSSSIQAYQEADKVKIITDMLKENIHESLSLDDICKKVLLSKSTLQKLFKENLNTSVMEYFKQLKIQEAKTLIRQEKYNFTEIAGLLGYNSIHYFSRIFKNETGMTLSEYQNSVKKLIE